MVNKENEKVMQMLNEYKDIPIDTQHKQHVAVTLKAFVPVREQSTSMIFKQLFIQAILEIWHRQKVELCTLFVVLFSLYFMLPDSNDYTLLFLVTTPLPLLLIGWRMLEDQGKDMVELLLTYKFTFQQLICAKIVAICSIAFSFYTFLSVYVMFTMNTNLYQSIFQLLITGITPILAWAVVLLIVQIKYRSNAVWSILILGWILFSILVIYTPFGDILLAAHVGFYLIFNSILILALVKLLMKTWRLERVSVD